MSEILLPITPRQEVGRVTIAQDEILQIFAFCKMGDNGLGNLRTRKFDVVEFLHRSQDLREISLADVDVFEF